MSSAAAARKVVDLDLAVKAYGSFTKLADRLGLTLSTVHGWHVRNKVPSWRERDLLAAANEDGHDILKTIKPKKKKSRKRVRQ